MLLLKGVLKNPKDPVKALQSLQEERNKLSKEIEALLAEKGKMVKTDLLNQIQEDNGLKVLVSQVDMPSADVLKKLSFELKNEVDNLVMVLAADIKGKPQISIVVDDALVKQHDLHAGKMVKELAKEIRGGGGGQPFFATAGGSDSSGLASVVTKAKEMIAALPALN